MSRCAPARRRPPAPGEAEVHPLRLPASKRWTDFGEVERVSLRQFYGWSANRRAKLCVSTFPCDHSHGAPTGPAAAFMIRPTTALSASTLLPSVSGAELEAAERAAFAT